MKKMKLDIQKFANGSFEFNDWDGSIRGKIEWNSTADNANNRSSVTAYIYARRPSSSTTGRQWNGYINIGGNNHSFSEIYTSTSTTIGTSWVLIEYFTDTINHETNGSKSITISGNVTGPSGTSLAGKSSWGSGTAVLDNIPRMSTPTYSANPVTLGNQVTITTNRLVDTYTHTLTYSIGSESGTIATNIGASTTWTPAITLANQMPNSTSGTCVITCETYDGTSLVGSTQTNLTLNVPSTVVPTVSIGTLTEADTTMISKNWGVFVQNKSKLNIPITSAGAYSSTIKSIITTINGVNFTGTPVITSTLVTTGTNTITTTVTDSRGKTATTTKNYSVVAYSNPNIEIAQVQRCLSDGTVSDNGTYLLINFKGSISAVSNNNTALFRIGYKLTTASSYTYVTLGTGYTINLANQVSSFTLSTDYSYDIIFEATDAFMTNTINRQIDTGFDLLNFNASGKAMAIGKVSGANANQELLEIALPTEISENTKIDGNLNVNGNINMNNTTRMAFSNDGSTFIGANSNNIVLRPNGTNSNTGQAILDTDGKMKLNSGGKYLDSTYDGTSSWNLNTDASGLKVNKQVTSDEGFYVTGQGSVNSRLVAEAYCGQQGSLSVSGLNLDRDFQYEIWISFTCLSSCAIRMKPNGRSSVLLQYNADLRNTGTGFDYYNRSGNNDYLYMGDYNHSDNTTLLVVKISKATHDRNNWYVYQYQMHNCTTGNNKFSTWGGGQFCITSDGENITSWGMEPTSGQFRDCWIRVYKI